MKENYIDYKKLTVEIPYKTFLQMKNYCTGRFSNDKKDMFYCDFIEKAIKYYIENHF